MSHSGNQTPAPLELRRERVVELLCQQVAADAITLEEFERRVDVAHRASTLAALDAVVRDLAALPATAPVPARPRLAEPADRRESQTMVAVMGGVTRRGRWTPARQNRLFAPMGGAELDFREAELGAGVTELTIVAFMGGAEIIVPPGLAVECNGVGIIGGFEHHSGATRGADATAPLLRIHGVALMGGVDVKVRLPGESAADARRRNRAEQRTLRKEQRQLIKSNRYDRGL
jgi:hypothetical protein